MQHRRRATTYGKAARKPISALSPAAADAFAHISIAEDLTELKQRPRPSCFKASASDSALRTGATTAKTQIQSPSPDRIPYSPIRTISATAVQPYPAVSGRSALYDVPSSDEGNDFEVADQHDQARKRRKITPKLASRELMADNRTLQKESKGHSRSGRDVRQVLPDAKHIERAAGSQALRNEGLAQHRVDHPPKLCPAVKNDGPVGHTSTLPGDGCRKSGQKAMHRMVASKQQAMGRKSFQKALAEPALASKNPNKPVNRIVAAGKHFVAGTGPKPSLPQQTKTEREDHFAKTRIKTPPRTPPRILKPASEITTPHQRDLWSKLLPTHTDYDSPSSLDLPKLRLSDTRTRSPSSETDHGIGNVPNDTNEQTPRHPRRRRIVDTLQSQQVESIEIDDMDEIDAADAKHELSGGIISDQDDNDEQTNAKLDQSHDSQAAKTLSNEQPARLSTASQNFHSACQPLPTLQGGSQKLTYAHQRSYLTENDLSEPIALGASELPLPAMERKHRRPALQSGPPSLQLTQGSQDDVEEHRGSQGAALRSIHELREAGGNLHLLNEIVAILDDIEDSLSSLSLKRSRLLELTKRLQEMSFRQLFNEHELELRLFGFIRHCADPLLKALIAAAILNLLTGTISSQALNHMSEPSIVGFFVSLLHMDQDLGSIAKGRSLNMSKAAQTDLRDYCNDIIGSNVWRAKPPVSLSPRVLSLQCLEYLVRRVREGGYGDNLLQQHDVQTLVQVLAIPTPVNASMQRVPDAELHLAVSILESCTITNQLGHEKFAWATDTLTTVVSLLPSLEANFKDVTDGLRVLVLRLYLNLTNNNPDLCETLATPAVLRSVLNTTMIHIRLVLDGTESDASRLDTLILALGLLINLAEWCASVPLSVMDLQYEDRSFLDHLVQLFKSSLDRTAEVYSEEETAINVAFGYLSVLLSYMCINGRVRQHLSSQLPGGNLKQLVSAVREFLQYHARIDKEIYDSGGDSDLTVGFTSRLQGVVDKLEDA